MALIALMALMVIMIMNMIMNMDMNMKKIEKGMDNFLCLDKNVDIIVLL